MAKSPHHHPRSEVLQRNEDDPRYAERRKQLGLRLKQLRKARKLSQDVASEEIGLHPVHLSRIETGDANVTLATLFALSDAYGVSTQALFDPPQTKKRR